MIDEATNTILIMMIAWEFLPRCKCKIRHTHSHLLNPCLHCTAVLDDEFISSSWNNRCVIHHRTKGRMGRGGKPICNHAHPISTLVFCKENAKKTHFPHQNISIIPRRESLFAWICCLDHHLSPYLQNREKVVFLGLLLWCRCFISN